MSNDSATHSQESPIVSQEWINSVVGRDWEVFWKPASQSIDEEDEHAEDWYAARIESYLGLQNGSPLFQISFVGDEEEYVMVATPNNVRPSSRAWVTRARALIHYPRNQELPPDTIQLKDREKLARIESDIRHHYPLLETIPPDIAPHCPPPDRQELEEIIEWMVLLEKQIFLRDQLGSLEEPEDVEDEDDEPTERYVTYLVDLLYALVKCCRWFYKCWQLHCSLERGTDPLFEKTEVIEEYLFRGREIMQTLVSIDTSPQASKGRRKAVLERPPPKGSRRTKRRKIMNKSFDDFVTADSGAQTLNDEISDEDMLSTDLVKRMSFQVQEIENTRALPFCRILRSISSNICGPLVRWYKRSEYYLGDSETLDVRASEGETSEEDSEDDGALLDSAVDVEKLMKPVRFEDVRTCLDTARTSRLLKRFHTSSTVERLERKASKIISFEGEAKNALTRIYDEIQSLEQDKVLSELYRLQSEMSSRDGDLWNVNPIGEPTAPIPRKDIDHAIQHRKWCLDLKRCESTRQRLALIQTVISGFSNLPSLQFVSGSDSASLGLNQIFANRVRALNSSVSEAATSLAHYNGIIDGEMYDRTHSLEQLLLTRESIQHTLTEFRLLPFIPTAEESLSIRLDILDWKARAENLFSAEKLSYEDLTSLKDESDSILAGQSPIRSTLVKGLRRNSEVESNIMHQAKKDFALLADTLHKDTVTKYQLSTSWKGKMESVMITLRRLGNEHAGERIESDKRPTLVELKNLSELVTEYQGLHVQISGAESLILVVSTARSWQAKVKEALSTRKESYEGWLGLISTLDASRPHGILVEPTDDSLKSIIELLKWYLDTLQHCQLDTARRQESFRMLVRQGRQVVKHFTAGLDFSQSHFFSSPRAFKFFESLSSENDARPTLNVEALLQDDWNRPILDGLLSDGQEKMNAHPVGGLVYECWFWILEELVASVERGSGSVVTLQEARQVMESMPDSSFVSETRDLVTRAQKLVDSSEELEREYRKTLSATKAIFREGLHQIEIAKEHVSLVKDIHNELRARSSGVGLRLDTGLENEAEYAMRVCTWFSRAIQYPSLMSDSSDTTAVTDDRRIQWDALIKLYESIPPWEENIGDFAAMILKVQELHAAAKGWQDEVSSLTNLSMRGSKKRLLSPSSEDDDQGMIDFSKVAELSDDPVLLQVAMPRESAMKNMLKNTEKFEALLFDFFGKDFNEKDADKATYPPSHSMIGPKGEFSLYRLTKSPLFVALKASIREISGVGDEIFAESPGKATFDWLCRAVDWIDAIEEAVDIKEEGRVQIYSMPFVEASKLVQTGEEILLEIPEDSKQTLGRHLISVSSNRDGKFTVKSKKGGAHNSVGTTTIRWLPILFEALKADVGKMTEWKAKLEKAIAVYTDARKQTDQLKVYHSYNTLLDCLQDSHAFFVYPEERDLHSLKYALENAEMIVRERVNDEAIASFFDQKYQKSKEVVKERFRLLDALSDRATLGGNGEKISNGKTEIKHGPFRDAAKRLIERAFLKGAKNLGLESLDDELVAFASLKAWETENALFSAYQVKNGHSRISAEYRDKTRAIKRSLEDPQNTGHILKILNDEVDGKALASMSLEELASPSLRESRTIAAASVRNILALPPSRNDVESTSSARSSTDPVQGGQKYAAVPKHDDSKSDLGDKSEAFTMPSATSTDHLSRDTLPRSPRQSRPLAPQALVASLRSTLAQPVSETFISSVNGNEDFQISVGAGKRNFSVTFSIERDPDMVADQVLPEKLTEKGRVKVEAFEQFISDLSENWSLAVLKMHVEKGTKNTQEYKKFYKDYESKRRIAMVEFGKDRLYLITPKFLKSFKKYTLSNPQQPYGILTVRKKA